MLARCQLGSPFAYSSSAAPGPRSATAGWLSLPLARRPSAASAPRRRPKPLRLVRNRRQWRSGMRIGTRPNTRSLPAA